MRRRSVSHSHIQSEDASATSRNRASDSWRVWAKASTVFADSCNAFVDLLAFLTTSTANAARIRAAASSGGSRSLNSSDPGSSGDHSSQPKNFARGPFRGIEAVDAERARVGDSEIAQKIIATHV